MVKGLSLVALQTLFRTEFNKAVGAYQMTNAWDAVGSFASTIPSMGPGETQRFLQELPEFQQWIGDLNVSDLAEFSYFLANLPFAAAVAVHQDELDDDADGIILERIRQMAGGETRKWGKLVDAAIKAGTTGLAFDAIAYFSDATGVRLTTTCWPGPFPPVRPPWPRSPPTCAPCATQGSASWTAVAKSSVCSSTPSSSPRTSKWVSASS
jgi:phage major head subunit gpT-like protein